MPALNAEQKQWQAQDDAYVLTQAEKIKDDGNRLKDAKAQAKVMVADKMKEVKSMAKVAGVKIGGSAKNDQELSSDPMASFVKATNAKRGG